MMLTTKSAACAGTAAGSSDGRGRVHRLITGELRLRRQEGTQPASTAAA